MGRMSLFTDKVQMDLDVYQNVGDGETIPTTIQMLGLDFKCKSYAPPKKSTKGDMNPKNVGPTTGVVGSLCDNSQAKAGRTGQGTTRGCQCVERSVFKSDVCCY